MTGETVTAEPSEAELSAARSAVESLPRTRAQLLPALLAAEHALGWLPRPAIEHVALHVRIPVSEVYATATAYSELRLKEPVDGQWRICTGIACREAGADSLLEALGERASAVDCRFLCALAPVAEDAGGALHGRCTGDRLTALARTAQTGPRP